MIVRASFHLSGLTKEYWVHYAGEPYGTGNKSKPDYNEDDSHDNAGLCLEHEDGPLSRT